MRRTHRGARSRPWARLLVVGLLVGCNVISGVDKLGIDRTIDAGLSETGAPPTIEEDAATPPPPPVDASDAAVDATEPPSEEAGPAAKLVFVTSAMSNGNIGGFVGADKVCAAAADAGAFGSHVFVAWLSTATTPAIDRIKHEGQYVMLDGRTVVQSKAQLTSGPLTNPIEIGELGIRIDVSSGDKMRVWTGTESNGTATGANCTDWTSSSGSVFGTLGLAVATDKTWTHSSDLLPGAGWGCQTVGHLYCFER